MLGVPILAAAWAVLNFIGDDGYLDIARKKLEATRKIMTWIEKNENLCLMGKPDMCLIAFTSHTISIFHLIDEMTDMGWYIQPALTFEGSKEHIHLSINLSNVERVDVFLKDLEQCVEKVKTIKFGKLAQTVEGFLSNMTSTQNLDDIFSKFIEMAGIQKSTFPKRMANVNEMLNVLPPKFRERLLIEFSNKLFCQKKD